MKINISKKESLIRKTPIQNKQFFIGIALGSNSTTETGIVIIDRNLELLRVDKLYTNPEVHSFLNNFNGLSDSLVMLALAPFTPLLNSKWRINERYIHAFSLHESAEDMKWANRYSERGKEIYDTLVELGIETYRFNAQLAKQSLHLEPPFKERSQPGCKYLQTMIKEYLNIRNLPSNLIPIASLEAIIGGYTGWLMATGKENEDYKFIEPFNDQPMVLPLVCNPMSLEEFQEEEDEKIEKKRAAKRAKKAKKRRTN